MNIYCISICKVYAPDNSYSRVINMLYTNALYFTYIYFSLFNNMTLWKPW